VIYFRIDLRWCGPEKWKFDGRERDKRQKIMLRRALLARALPATRIVVPRVAARFRAPMLRRYYVDEANETPKKTEQQANEGEPAKEEPVETFEELKKRFDELKTKFDAKDKETALLKERYTRSVADFRNLQDTTKREIQKAKDYALQKFAKDLLESVDNFDRALSVVPEDKRDDRERHKELVDLYEGIKMTQDVFERTLSRHGLVKLNPLGEKFDPNVHEATFEVPQPDKEPGTVFHVQQTGFSLHDRVLRAPKVGVVKGE
jgi:molecular chaperone GrpE